LGVPDAKVKKVIKDLDIKPKARKGVCNHYAGDAGARIRGALK
jgi:hypothetical protein